MCNVVSGARTTGENGAKRAREYRVSLQYAPLKDDGKKKEKERARENARPGEETGEEINDSISFLFQRQFYCDFPALHRQIRLHSG